MTDEVTNQLFYPIEYMERILIDADTKERSITWEALGYEAGLEHVSVFTI